MASFPVSGLIFTWAGTGSETRTAKKGRNVAGFIRPILSLINGSQGYGTAFTKLGSCLGLSPRAGGGNSASRPTALAGMQSYRHRHFIAWPVQIVQAHGHRGAW